MLYWLTNLILPKNTLLFFPTACCSFLYTSLHDLCHVPHRLIPRTKPPNNNTIWLKECNYKNVQRDNIFEGERWLSSALVIEKVTYFVADLVTTLSNLNVDYFSHPRVRFEGGIA